MTQRWIWWGCLLAVGSGHAADRAIAVPPTVRSSWAFETHVSGARLRPQLAVGFWQRASGAKPGVGANFVSALEYQLPEAAPQRVRSASFQFSGTPSQCVGAEPVVIDVFAYAADGRADVRDGQSGTRIAQLSARLQRPQRVRAPDRRDADRAPQAQAASAARATLLKIRPLTER